MAYGDSEIRTIKLAAVEGTNNDWALYWGPESWEDWRVKDSGLKVKKAAAEALVYYYGIFKSPEKWARLIYRE